MTSNKPPRWIATSLLFVMLGSGAEAGAQAGAQASSQRRSTERVQFVTEDEVTVHADLHEYGVARTAPVLVLFHDASGSRGEYRPVLRRFQDLGYACMVVDLRVGGRVGKVPNFTATGFPELNEDKDIFAAQHDLRAALVYARSRFPDRSIVAVGCSFSAAHALRIGATEPELLDGILAFSAAEFFGTFVESKTYVQDALGGLACPVLFLSARAEEGEWKPLYDATSSDRKRSFLPSGRGRHGIRALWEATAEGAEYWGAVESFLKDHFPGQPLADGDETEGEGREAAGKGD